MSAKCFYYENDNYYVELFLFLIKIIMGSPTKFTGMSKIHSTLVGLLLGLSVGVVPLLAYGMVLLKVRVY